MYMYKCTVHVYTVYIVCKSWARICLLLTYMYVYCSVHVHVHVCVYAMVKSMEYIGIIFNDIPL